MTSDIAWSPDFASNKPKQADERMNKQRKKEKEKMDVYNQPINTLFKHVSAKS